MGTLNVDGHIRRRARCDGDFPCLAGEDRTQQVDIRHPCAVDRLRIHVANVDGASGPRHRRENDRQCLRRRDVVRHGQRRRRRDVGDDEKTGVFLAHHHDGRFEQGCTEGVWTRRHGGRCGEVVGTGRPGASERARDRLQERKRRGRDRRSGDAAEQPVDRLGIPGMRRKDGLQR